MAWKSFLRENLHFVRRGNTPLSPRPEKIAVPPLPNWGCYHHMCNHAAAQHSITCDLLWCLSMQQHTSVPGVPVMQCPTLQTPASHIGNLEVAVRAFEESPHMCLPKILTCLAVLSIKADWHILVLVPSWTREVKSIHRNGLQHFLWPFHIGITWLFPGEMQGWR